MKTYFDKIGLNFFRKLRLTIDFQKGVIDIK